jgi:hypothetical protein
MRAGLALCPHLAGIAPGPAPPFTLAPGEILDWSDGPVEAVVRCRVCGACGWLELLDWDPRRPLRVFALAAVRETDVALYLRDRARGSCDVARERAELEALAASCGPFERIVALELPELRVVAAADAGPAFAPPAGAWSERIPAREDARWFTRLGLAKGAPG